jgi:hypothetical protein
MKVGDVYVSPRNRRFKVLRILDVPEPGSRADVVLWAEAWGQEVLAYSWNMTEENDWRLLPS